MFEQIFEMLTLYNDSSLTSLCHELANTLQDSGSVLYNGKGFVYTVTKNADNWN